MGLWPTFYNWCDECKSYVAEHDIVKHKYSRKCPLCGNPVYRYRNVDGITYATIKKATEELLRKQKLEYVPNSLPKKGTGYIPAQSARCQHTPSPRWRQPHKRVIVHGMIGNTYAEDVLSTESSKKGEHSELSDISIAVDVMNETE